MTWWKERELKVRELIEQLERMDPELQVDVELTIDDGDDVRAGVLRGARAETRCDDVERCYLLADEEP